MIIAGGKIYDSKMQDRILSVMERKINMTLAGKPLAPERVIDAIDRLGKDIGAGKYDSIIDALPVDEPRRYKLLASEMLTRENMELKLRTELVNVPEAIGAVKTKIMPLGVIFHIAAGNMDGLPAFSIAEGLLTGNINILKLPQADNGLSVEIINRLLENEPDLADYIYVFDTPSSDIRAMQKMAAMADGIAVWGGDEAVRAVRQLAPVSARLIEWGHKLGFVYISCGSAEDIEQKELEALAGHIVSTKQLLCSSCQVIYVDTDNEAELHKLCKRFLPILEKAVCANAPKSIGGIAHKSLLDRTDLLESFIQNKTAPNRYKGKGCSLTVCSDSELELSPMMCNVLVKKLPREKIVSVLRRKKGYLQTAGLICSDKERGRLSEIFAKCGVTRITSAGDMSEFFIGEGHDGEYPLMRYVRVVNWN